MNFKSYVAVLVMLFLLASNVHSQPFDPYARVSDPRAICRLDGADTLPVRIFSGVAFPRERNPYDGNFVIAKDTGSGIITHLWLMYHELPADSLMLIRIWVDDSMVVSSYLYSLFKKQHGSLRAPLDSLASGGLNCDVQIPYKRNFMITYYSDFSICCLFWGIEYRRIIDSTILESFRLHPSFQYDQQQRAAERAIHNNGSPWDDASAKIITSGNHQLQAGSTDTVASISGQGIIESIRFTTKPSEVGNLESLRLRMYWDDSPIPSVDVPFLHFFGCGSGFRNVNSLRIKATESGELASYLPMPFFRSARIVLENTSPFPVTINSEAQYSLETVDRYNQGYFYTQYFQSVPARWHIYHPIGRMLGRGKFIGVHLALPEYTQPNYLEGDPFIDVDSNDDNRIHYTGLEDYLTGGWFFSDSIFSLPFAGCTRFYSSSYRFNLFDANDFQKSFHFDLQHGVNNDFLATFRSVAFFYRRWTPFWVDRDTIHPKEHWYIGGSGYQPNQVILAKLGTNVLLNITADASGNFNNEITIPNTIQKGIYTLSVNGYDRPEPIYLFKNPTVQFIEDSVPHLFRYKDSLLLTGTGFQPGEKVSVFVDSTEVIYLPGSRIVDDNYSWKFSVRLPWLKEGVKHIVAKGDRGSIAIADTAFTMTRTVNYECENLPVLLSEEFTQTWYFGYQAYSNWSNMYVVVFYPSKKNTRIEFGFNVEVSDTFRISLFNTIGVRFGIYDIVLDGQNIANFNGYFDTSKNIPFRSPLIDGGVHYLEKGFHKMAYYNRGPDSRGNGESMLEADNFILTPTTSFHPLPKDTEIVVVRINPSNTNALTLAPNPLHQNDIHIHVDLDSTFRLHSDVLVIELYDILGREVASVVNGTIGVHSLDLTQDCSKLVAGKYLCRMRVISPTNTTEQTVSFVIDR